MANLTKTTQDHDEIQRWAEERGGKPSHVKRTGSAEDIGILRIDFPGYSGEDTLEPISWEQWFEKFDDRKLALLYQEETAGGERSNFNKIVSAETAAEAEEKSQGGGRKASAGSRSKGSAGKKAASKKAASKKPANTGAKKTAKSASKAPARKTAARSASKKAGAKKSSRSSAAAKKSASSRSVKKTAAKRTASKKSTAKKRR
jgi:hypothetical protein